MPTKILLLIIILCNSISLIAAIVPKPEMQSALEILKEKQGTPVEKLSVKEAREKPSPQAVAEVEALKVGKLHKITDIEISDIEIEGAQGKLPARIYKPQGSGLLPVVLYFHGGGWVLGKNEDYDATLKTLAQKTQAIYLSPEYRKAPEYKFPAAHEDAYASYVWLLNNAKSIGADPNKIAVAGESAGGNLAMNVSIKARDENKPLPVHQLIIYPLAGNEPQKISTKQNLPLTKKQVDWYMKNYLRSPSDLKDKRINLVEANLKGLPPTTILTAEIDPLRNEGKTLVKKLEKAGVQVNYRDYKGMTHEFFSMGPILYEARQAQEEAADELKDSFQ